MESAKDGGEATGLRKVQGDSGMDDNILDCPVCMTGFNNTVQRPRTLPCGHTFCTPCINGLKNHGYVTCPTCRVEYPVPEVGLFPINYAYEALIRRMRELGLASPTPTPEKDMGEPAFSPATGSGQKKPVGLSSAIRSMLQEQEDKVLAAIRTCQEVQGQLDHYQATLAVWDGQQHRLDDRLQALMDRNNNARVLMQHEGSQVATKKEQIRQREQQLHAMLQTLRTVTTRKEAYEAIDDADHSTDEERQRTEECRGMFPDGNTVSTIRKAIVTSRAAVKASESVECDPTGAVGDRSLPADPTSTITERLQSLLAPTLQAEDLRTLTQPARNLLQGGLVFATHKTEDQSRHARINLEDGRLCLHFLKDQTVPPGAAILQMDKVVPAAPPCMVFLDLGWPGSAPRRVLIHLSPNTPLGQQFILLCTGQRGPCYVNTRLWWVGNKGQAGEWVGGGDYEKNDGTGGAAILPDLDKGEYRQIGLAGSLCRAWRGDEHNWNARFGIYTKDREDGGHAKYVFGEVVGGLESVAAAAQHSPIEEVTVVDCGVVL